MKVTFARGLQECYEHFDNGKRRWGESIARKYVQRINLLKASRDIQALRTIRALRLHQLHGDRGGHYSLHLHDRWRLLFVFNEDSKVVFISEVTNHYGD